MELKGQYERGDIDAAFKLHVKPRVYQIGRFRHPCGLDSEVFQSFRHQVQAAQVEKDRHPETFTIAKPTGHILIEPRVNR